MSRTIRSYVIREGRITAAQRRALEELLPRFGVTPASAGDTPYPLFLEIGIGNGDNLVQVAAAQPGNHYVGCDPHRPGIGHALLEIERRALDNVRVWAGDARDLLDALPPASLSGIYIYFPDPWPKKRHHKRRLVDAAFLARVHRRLRGEGVCRFASDDDDYARSVRELVDASPQWLNLAGAGAWAPRPVSRPLTRFERRALNDGRAVRELAFMPAVVPATR